jgi:predicted Fe-Mo cluster-binding NifX family protein
MKIAVAISTGGAVSTHFGRSSGFAVFDVEDNKVVGREQRTNTFTAHAQGQCGGEGHHHTDSHGHGDIVSALSDCSIVLCGGMGQRAAEDLSANGIRPFVIEGPLTAEDAVNAFLSGRLKAAGSFCGCSGHGH